MKNIRNHRTTQAVLASFALLLAAISAEAASPNLVIAEVYGGGGNSGATYKNDFIVLFNRGNSAVDVNGWSVQYASAAGTSWSVTTLATTSAIIPPGGYFLIQEAQGSGGAVDLPTPDVIGTIAMGAGGGKVALVDSTTALTGTVPGGIGVGIIDFVGFGNAGTYEGSGATPTPSATLSAQRANEGCLDSDNNAADFVVGAPNPRNSASQTHSCGAAIPPVISGVSPTSATVNAGTTVNFTVTLSEGDAPLTYYWFKSGGGTDLLLDQTGAMLTLANVVATDTGSYYVIVSNASTLTATSPLVTLSVTDPAINFQPVSQVNLAGSTTAFSVNAAGVAPLTYQWYRGQPAPGANTALSDGGKISGSQTKTLYINETAAGDADSYFVIVTSGNGSITSEPATLDVATSGALVTWDYNALGLDTASAAPSQGQGTARTTTVGTTNSFQPTGGTPNDPYNSMIGATNYYYGTATYPNNGTSNKQAGVQFSVSTVGFKNLTVSFDQRASSTASKYTRLQFTTNGVDYTDYPTSTAFFGASAWESRSYSLVGFPGVVNNPDFAFRVVSEFEATATLGAVDNSNYVGIAGTTASYGTSGTLSYDLVKVEAEPIEAGNIPPTISSIENQNTRSDTPIVINFTVGDAETSASALDVTAISYDQTLVSDFMIVPGGSGASRNLTITPNGSVGTVAILVSVSDGVDVAVAWFNLTLDPLDVPPTITQISNTNTLVNTPVTIPFVIGDDSPVSGLTLSYDSLNTELLPPANITITGTGANRELVLTPAADTLGTAPVRLSVSDGNSTTTTTFALVVRSNANVIFNDLFSYTDGNLVDASGRFWTDHSGSTALTVSNGKVTIDGTRSQDANAPLIGAPYETNSSAVLYSSFKVNFSVLPTSAGAYFAHFKDNSTFGFYGRVWATTNGAAEGKLRLSIGNASNANATSGQFPQDLTPGEDYTVVTRLVLSNGQSTIWVNPTSESDTHVTDTTTVTNTPIYQYALRQASGEGTLSLDDLVIGTSFAAVTGITTPEPIALTIQYLGGEVILTWPDPQFRLEAAPDLSSGFADVPDATSPYHYPVSGGQRFFRLAYP